MTQEKANKIFETELGLQLDVIYSTFDDKLFIRPEEALNHLKGLISSNSKNNIDTTITEWYREDYN